MCIRDRLWDRARMTRELPDGASGTESTPPPVATSRCRVNLYPGPHHPARAADHPWCDGAGATDRSGAARATLGAEVRSRSSSTAAKETSVAAMDDRRGDAHHEHIVTDRAGRYRK